MKNRFKTTKGDLWMSATEAESTDASVRKRAPRKRAAVRASRPRSAITSGRTLFIDGDPNSAWSRRFHDLIVAHVNDISPEGGANALSDAQLGLIRRAAAIECELERLDAMLSRGKKVDMDSYARISGHLRRMWETLGLERSAKEVNDMKTFLAKRKRIAALPSATTEPEPEPIV
jgi:hypothetical protein